MCDDGWFVTYGYILFDNDILGLPSELVKGLPSEFVVFDIFVTEVVVEFCDEICELINCWNCGYFGSMLI